MSQNKPLSSLIYLDNNATTMMPPSVINSMMAWVNMGNPSASYASAKECQKLMKKCRDFINTIITADFSRAKEGRGAKSTPTSRSESGRYEIIFTSGATESNCTIVRSAVDSYKKAKGAQPHLVMSAIEHKSLLDLAQFLEDTGTATTTLVAPQLDGRVAPGDVAAAIRDNTCLITIMHANNETGAVNDVAAIGKIAHSRNIPFHTDVAQSFGKFPPKPDECNIDAMSLSFHKIHGPPGIGALILRRAFIDGYDLHPIIFGSQNGGMRGGTENIIGIAGAMAALIYTFTGRIGKNKALYSLRNSIINAIAGAFTVRLYTTYTAAPNSTGGEIVVLGGAGDVYMPSTILLSVVKKTQPYICNVDMKKELEKRGIIVSIGSACNTASPQASHVLYAMRADEYIRKGTLRISLDDNTTADQAERFVFAFIEIVKELIPLAPRALPSPGPHPVVPVARAAPAHAQIKK